MAAQGGSVIGASISTTQAFFDGLGSGEPVPALGSSRGTIRFDIRDGDRIDHWRVTVNRDEVVVDRTDGKADCVISTTREVFDQIAGGHLNALPAALRGLVDLDGDPSFVIRFQRLFPAAEGRSMPTSSRTVGRQRS